jgi:Ca-activated chloride channel family protein
MILNIRPDRKLIRAAGHSRRYVLVNFTSPSIPPKEGRTPINISLVLDRSGSMGGQKIELVREAVRKALAMLRPEDRFSLVVYDDRIDVLVTSTPASAEARRNAERILAQIDARGSTNLGGGWLTGCEQIAAHLDPGVLGRALLLTDGLANQGITDHDELVHHAEELRSRQITTSTFGVGSDFDETLLQRMATAGGGNSYFIERNVQILDYLTSELGEALEVVARDAAVELILPASVQAEPLHEFRHVRDGNTMRVHLGDIVSGQEISLILRLDFPTGEPGEKLAMDFCLSDRERVLDAPPCSLAWEFADHQANDTQARDRDVDRAVAQIYAARARDEALSLNRAGHFEQARAVLRRAADRIREYAREDRVLLDLAEELLSEQDRYASHMSAMEMKARYYSSMNLMKSRDPQGKARRTT